MKKSKYLVMALALVTAFPFVSQAQLAGGGSMPNFSGALSKFFGDNKAFSANVQMDVKGPEEASMPGKVALLDGKTRFEMDMSQLKTSRMPQAVLDQMKTMGMDKLILITEPAKKSSLLIYPGLQSYVSMPMKDADAAGADEFKVEFTDLGKEKVDGHDCVKSKAVVTDSKGESHEATLWSATDMKKFPIKITQSEKGNETTMLFSQIKLEKPDAALFAPAASFTKYPGMQEMMQEVMMKKLGNGAPGAPTAK